MARTPINLGEFQQHSAIKSGEFLGYLLSIAYVESRFNSQAKSPAGAYGLLQLTLPGAVDAALECGLPSVHPSRLLHPTWNIVYSSCLLRRYLKDAGGSWFHALILYNGGYVQLTRYNSTGVMAKETQDYVLKVMHVHGLCLAH